MAELVALDFMRPVASSSIDGESEFLFWHALARDVAYGQLPRKVRARKHEAAARWIEQTGSDRADEFAEITAHHYLAALDLARAVGDAELTAALLAPTIRVLGRAGQRALRLDIVAAECHFARALELAGPGTGERLVLLPGWAEALMLRSRHEEAAAAYEEAIAGYRAGGDVRATARAMCWLADLHAVVAEPSMELMQAAVGSLAEDGDSSEKAEVLAHYAMLLAVEDVDPHLTLDAATRAVEMCKRLGLPEPALAMSCCAHARINLGDLGGLGDYGRALDVAREQGLGMERATIEFNYGSLVGSVRGPRAARELLSECLKFARSRGLEAYVVSTQGALAETARDLGEWDLALDEASRLDATVEGRKGVWDLLIMRGVQALVLAARGEPGAVEPFVSWLEKNGRETEVIWAKALALLAASSVRLRLRETPAALSLLREWLATPHALLSYFGLVPESIRTAMAAGDGELACRVAQALEASLPPATLPLHEHVRSAVRALAAETRGEYGAAAAGFADAAGRWRQFGMPYEEEHALLGQGRCLVTLGRAPGAAAPLAAAREIFARLGAKPALAETDEVLRRASQAQRVPSE
jgi:hypothetical protein